MIPRFGSLTLHLTQNPAPKSRQQDVPTQVRLDVRPDDGDKSVYLQQHDESRQRIGDFMAFNTLRAPQTGNLASERAYAQSYLVGLVADRGSRALVEAFKRPLVQALDDRPAAREIKITPLAEGGGYTLETTCVLPRLSSLPQAAKA